MLHPSSTRSFIRNLPSKTDQELLDPPTDSTDSENPRNIEFFVQSLKLIHYLGDILEHLHALDTVEATKHPLNEDTEERQRKIGTGQFQRMLDLDATLVKWRKQLPAHVQTQYGEPGSIFRRQSQVLRARYGNSGHSLPVMLTDWPQVSSHANIPSTPCTTCSLQTWPKFRAS
jgi:hypothetical protein